MAYVYKITNDINGKIYIGKTYNSIEKRFKEHCKDRLKRRCEQRPLYSAMNKYGIEHFHIELLEETTNPEEREKYWIEYYGSFKNGYNATTGGDGKPYVDIDIIISLWEEGKTIKEIHDITGYDKKTIAIHLKNNNISSCMIQNRAQERKRKVVLQLNKNTNEIINVFQSINAAAESINKHSYHISEACNGKRKTAYGYKWKFKEENKVT